MKCQGCGHDYPSTLTRCTKCGKQNSRRGRSYSDSRLIEFPRQTRAQGPAAEASVPAWRAEVTEKVRQMRARRSGEAAEVVQQQAPVAEPEVPKSTPSTAARAAARDAKVATEGGLTRIRRANQDAARGITALSTPSAQAGANIGLGHDRGATARALDPIDDPQQVAVPKELPAQSNPPNAAPSAARADRKSKLTSEQPVTARSSVNNLPSQARPAAATVATSQSTVGHHAVAGSEAAVLDPLAAGPLDGFDELDPLDYLTAEVRKVDQALARELAGRPTATLFSRMVSGVVDLVVIALSAVPFLLLIQLANGNLVQRLTPTLVGGIVLLLAFFYLAFTQCLCGRTFGMMATNTHIADAASRKSPTVTRSLARTIGLFVALAPAGLGLIWAVFDREGRCWQDIISGTVVISDF